MRKIESEEEFEVLWRTSEALVVEFSSAWCEPCEIAELILIALQWDFPDVTFVKVEVGELHRLSETLDIEAVPTTLFVSKGKVVKRIVGVERSDVLGKCANKLLALRERHRCKSRCGCK